MKNRNNVIIRCTLGAALFVALFTTYQASAACYTPNSIPPNTPTYDAVYPENNTKATCPPTGAKSLNGYMVKEYALTMDEAPSPASVVCSEGGWTNDCVAWPQGSQITYVWSATGGVTLDYVPSPHDYEVVLNCTGNASGTARLPCIRRVRALRRTWPASLIVETNKQP